MHAGEGKLRLGLDADGKQRLRAHFARARAGVVEQRRLSDAGLAGDHDRPTPVVRAIDKGTDSIRLDITPDQRGAQTQSA